MLVNSITLLAISATAALCDAGVVSVPIVRQKTAQRQATLLRKSVVSDPLNNDVFSYTAELEIGTPPQKVYAQLDTGSSDLWLYASPDNRSEVYNPNISSTYSYYDSHFYIYYYSGSDHGDWVNDTISIGGAVIPNQLLGNVASSTASGGDTGILGIGLIAEEYDGFAYNNVPASLKATGAISTNAYSLFLNDLDASTGTILFGGVDLEKFDGELVEVPFVDSYRFTVNASLPEYGGEFVGWLDSGTSLTYLPGEITDRIAAEYNATYNSAHGGYFLDDMPTKGLKYRIGTDAYITIPPSELALETADLYGAGAAPQKYYLSVFPNNRTSGTNFLGDSFLRSAYVVYDLENLRCLIAQASYSTESVIIPI